MNIMLAPDTIVRAAPEDQVVACALEGEAALLHLAHGTYYGLNAVGAYVWELARSGRSLAQLQQALTQRFEVTDEQCHADLVALLQDMEEAGLVIFEPPSA